MKKENIRGVAYYQSLRTRYLNCAKEASASGDRVLYEYNLQFAEHYGRLIDTRFSRPQGDQNYGVRNVGGEQSSYSTTTATSGAPVANAGNSIEQGNIRTAGRRMARHENKTKLPPAGETLS
jgi:hypothetical protein